MTATEAWRILYGTEEAQPAEHRLRAGPLTVVLRDGQLGAIVYKGTEIIRGIAFLVRDANWGTLDAAIRDLVIDPRPDGFVVSYAAHCGETGIGLDYTVTIIGQPHRLSVSARAEPEADFMTNRTGFVILHPLEGVIGHPINVEHADGRRESVLVREPIAPDQPIFDIRRLTHLVNGFRVSVQLAGGSYEMEDQRNWCDASLKTYIRPLSKPRPYVLPAGEVIEQSIDIRVAEPEPRAPALPKPIVPAPRFDGRLPEIGIALDGPQRPYLRDSMMMAAAKTPHRILLRLERADAQAEALCAAAAELAAMSGAKLSADLIVDGDSATADLAAYHALLKKTSTAVDQIMPCTRRDLTTRPSGQMRLGEASMAAILEATRRIFPDARIGGGVLTSFTEFNRNPPPADEIDFLAHATTAIAHAADDASVFQTLEALPHVIASARHLVPGCDYRLGPSAIGARDNPYGTATAPNPHGRRITMARCDPRHFALFGAAWTLAYLAVAAAQQIDQVILGDVAGDFGVIASHNGAPSCNPLFHVLRAVARADRAWLLPIDLPEGLVGVTYMARGRFELLVANTTLIPRRLPATLGFARVATLDAASAAQARHNPEFLDKTDAIGEALTLEAYCVSRLLA